MKESEIYVRLNEIFRKTLGNDSIELAANTTANDVPEWDSMNNIFLMVAIEQTFSIKFRAAEMERLSNVGSLVQLISGKICKTT
jgi:acyl carrier protein